MELPGLRAVTDDEALDDQAWIMREYQLRSYDYIAGALGYDSSLQALEAVQRGARYRREAAANVARAGHGEG
jgi:hypothetical protein